MSQLVIPELDIIPPADGEKVYRCGTCGKDHPRITSLLDATCPKYALVPWAEGVGRRAMWSVMDETPGLSLQGATEQIKARELTANAERDKGGGRGTAVHQFLSTYIQTDEVVGVNEFPEEVRPYLVTLSQFLVDYEPEFHGSEIYVAHHDLDFAGTLDGIATINRQPPGRNKPFDLYGKRVLFDLKSNRDGRVYPPAMLYQVAGYELAWRSLGGEPNEHQIVVAVGDGSYQVKVSHYEPESFIPLVRFYHDQQRQNARGKRGK